MQKLKNGRLIALSAAFMLVIPFVSGVFLTFILSKINGDVMYESLYSILNTAKNVIDWLAVYISLSLLCVSVLERKNVIRIAVMYAFSLVIPYLGAFLSSALLTTDFADMFLFYLIQTLIGLGAGAVVMTGAMLISYSQRGKLRKTPAEVNFSSNVKPSAPTPLNSTPPTQLNSTPLLPFKNPYATSFAVVCALLLALNLLSEATVTASFFSEYGTTATTEEIISMVTSYLLYFVYAIIGWFVMAAGYFVTRVNKSMNPQL